MGLLKTAQSALEMQNLNKKPSGFVYDYVGISLFTNSIYLNTVWLFGNMKLRGKKELCTTSC